jgi:tRNA A37 N6-isopentenylltransferase MiaA
MISKRIEEIISRGKVPIIEGGSVFYTKMLLTNTSDYDQSEEMEAMEINIMKPLRVIY